MMSVQSLLQRSSGNKPFAILSLSAVILCACSATKKTVIAKPVIKKEVKNNNAVIHKALPDKIDTIAFKEIPSKAKEKDRMGEDKHTAIFTPLSQIKMMALIPFKSNELDTTDSNIPNSNLRFVQYYAGMKLALTELNITEHLPIQLDVFDTGDNEESKEQLLKSQTALPQVVIGPYKPEAIKYSAEWAKKNETFVISPWISSSGITEKNPYYFQCKAGLVAHYQLINEHVRTHFPIENVILISRSKEESKLKVFNNLPDDPRSIREEIISEEDLANRPDAVLEKYFAKEGPSVFILPLASSRDENYIYHFLRRVISEKNNRTVIVYGLYKWLEMKSDILEYINNLDVRISISNFVDNERPEVKTFKRKYYETYHEFPTQDALEGYDLTKFLIASFSKYGKQFYLDTTEPESDYLETQFKFTPIYKSNHESTRDVDYYENKFIKLIEIKENKYRIVD